MSSKGLTGCARCRVALDSSLYVSSESTSLLHFQQQQSISLHLDNEREWNRAVIKAPPAVALTLIIAIMAAASNII